MCQLHGTICTIYIFAIKKYLTQSATETIIHAFVTSQFYLNNGLLYGISKKLVRKLQKVQHAAAPAYVIVILNRLALQVKRHLEFNSVQDKHILQIPVYPEHLDLDGTLKAA